MTFKITSKQDLMYLCRCPPSLQKGKFHYLTSALNDAQCVCPFLRKLVNYLYHLHKCSWEYSCLGSVGPVFPGSFAFSENNEFGQFCLILIFHIIFLCFFFIIIYFVLQIFPYVFRKAFSSQYFVQLCHGLC